MTRPTLAEIDKKLTEVEALAKRAGSPDIAVEHEAARASLLVMIQRYGQALPFAFERLEDCDERGIYSVLMAVDEEGEVELDRWPDGGAVVEAHALNADPTELRQCMEHARNQTGPWSPVWETRR